jgi:hypothetical protein
MERNLLATVTGLSMNGSFESKNFGEEYVIKAKSRSKGVR